MPGKGEMVIFNRSHYEDILVVRVHKLVDNKTWRSRYAEINRFEEMLANEGTKIVKFFLNIDAEEQKNRLEARLRDESKRWKFNPDDLKERKLWNEYMKAYQDALAETSTAWAPVVHRAVKPQMVPQSGRLHRARRDAQRTENGLSHAARGIGPDHGPLDTVEEK